NKVVNCTKGPVSTLAMTPTTALIAGMGYLVYIGFNPPAAPQLSGYPDGTVMASSGVLRIAPTSADAFSGAVAYKWGTQKHSTALGGSYLQEQYPGATASFTATGASLGIITWNGPDGGVASVKVTTSTGAVVTRNIDTYAAHAHDVTTTING